jgi:hypothetical protein
VTGITDRPFLSGEARRIAANIAKLPELFAQGLAGPPVSKRLGSPYRSGRTAHWVKVQNPESSSGKARGLRGLAVMATYKRRKFLNQGKRPENKHTDPAPIRAKAPLIEQFYVAVDRQLKSGFETYEAAEKAAQEIKRMERANAAGSRACRWLCLEWQDLSEPVAGRPRDHGDPLERAKVLRPAG